MKVNWLIMWVVFACLVLGILGAIQLAEDAYIQGPTAFLIVAVLLGTYWLADRANNSRDGSKK